MPTSPYTHLQTFINFLIDTRPRSILDIGLGNGKLGFLARDLLDVMLGERYRREEWQVRIDGIEVFADYIQNHQKYIYDRIFIGDAFEIVPQLESYETIFLGDVLEHFDKARGWQFLDRCAARATRHLIINIPLGDAWEQPEIYGNPYERHRSAWSWEEFEPFTWQYKFFKLHPGTYATLLIRKEDYATYKIGNLYPHQQAT